MVIKCLASWDTEYCADTVEWCPDPSGRDVFAVGTYQVLNDPQNSTFDGKSQRKGRLYLGTFDGETLHINEQLETRAILDLKWCPATFNHLASVDSGGGLAFYSLEEQDGRSSLKLSDKSFGVEDLLLSLDWRHDKIALSDGGGHLTVLASDSLENLFRTKAHDFEAWITAMDSFDSNLVFSGGDDCKLKGFDVRTTSPSFVCKEHSAGVTSLLSHPSIAQKLFSGSYDEILREWDTRQMRTPLKEIHLGGGVWRIKYNPERKLIAAACMHNGYHLISEDGEIQDSFMEHESLAYGLDWHRSKSRLGASCSFYDHVLKIWEISEQ